MQEIVFVFGSNLLDVHGAGAAKKAKEKYGAQTGVGHGRTGMAWAIPTKKTPSIHKRQFKLSEIKASVDEFVVYAGQYPETLFVVTEIGCGLAGYHDYEIAPMFKDAPRNCLFSPNWTKYGLPSWNKEMLL